MPARAEQKQHAARAHLSGMLTGNLSCPHTGFARGRLHDGAARCIRWVLLRGPAHHTTPSAGTALLSAPRLEAHLWPEL